MARRGGFERDGGERERERERERGSERGGGVKVGKEGLGPGHVRAFQRRGAVTRAMGSGCDPGDGDVPRPISRFRNSPRR
jgi:hypothetical protein